MFGKILRAGKGGHGLKYKIDVQITQLENLPSSVKKCRVVWARSAKLQITDVKDVRASIASFKQTLTQVTTMYRDKSGKLEPKEYEFKVQVPGKSSSDSAVSIGKATLDMSKFCRDETSSQSTMLPITFKIGATTTGYLKMVITTVFLGDSNDDGLTEVSGMTGLTSDHGSVREQDLDGFADDDHSKFGKRSKSKREDAAATAAATSTSGRSAVKSDGTRRRKPLPPTAEEDASDLEEEEESEASPPPAAKLGRKKSHNARQPPQEEALEEEANPFAKKVSKAPAKKPAPKVWEDDEDVSPLNSDVSDSEQRAPPPKAKSKFKEPEESFDDMKNSLFSTKKASGSVAATAGSAASAATGASSKAAGNSKASKVSAPPPAVEEDEEALRNDLFSAKPKAAAVASKSGAGKTAVAAGAGAIAGVAAAEAAAGASKHKSKHSHAAAAPPPPQSDEEEEEDYDDYGPSTSAAAAPAASSKSRHRTAEVAEAPVAKAAASTGLARAGSAKPDASKGGSAAELDELRQRVTQLERQLADERAAKDDLSKKMQKYVDKIADLEDQLAEGDVTELYTQMREMEAKHQEDVKEMEAKYQAEIKELMERHLAEVEELEERHRAELEEHRAELEEHRAEMDGLRAELEELRAAASSSRARGADVGASAEELKRLQSELREQEGLLKSRTAKMEAEVAAAVAARQAAESKLADANKMVDESLLVASKHQQENKTLQAEVARLKRQIEDASMWETSAAVAAVTAASNNGARRSEDDEELEELREKVEELQEKLEELQAENARLQKLNEANQQAVEDMLYDINGVLRDNPGVGAPRSTSDSSQCRTVAMALRNLCDAFTVKSAALRDMESRLDELSQQAAKAKVKPHELLSRVQQLTAERDALQDQIAACRQADADLAAAQQTVAQLQQQVDKLAAEKEAVERFKAATITDLRRQNDELRSSLRSLSSANLSPRYTFDEDAQVDMGATTSRSMAVGAVEDAGTGNWHEFESLVAQLKADRSELHRQVEQLKADKATLGKQLQDLRSAGGATAAGLGAMTDSPGPFGSSRHADRQRLEELEQERAQLQAEVTRLQAQVAELADAEAVIKEWSDYADGLVAEKAKLEEQVQELTRQLAVRTAAAGLGAVVAAGERRVGELQRLLATAEKRAAVLAQQAEELERRAVEAESRAEEVERRAEAAERSAEELQRLADDAQRHVEELELRAQDAEGRADDAERRARSAERRADKAEGLASDAERRAQDCEHRAAAAERAAEEAGRRADEAAAAAAASGRAREEPALAAAMGATAAAAAASPQWPQAQPADPAEVMELRHEISRLEASLSGLRVQLIESQSRTVSVAGDEVASSSRTRHRDLTAEKDARSQSRWGVIEDDDDEASSSGGGEDAPGLSPGRVLSERGWDAELEQLRARNASLEAIIAGLQASISSLQEEKVARTTRKAEQQILDLQQRLATALKEKAELVSTLLLLRSELECTPLVRHGSAADASTAARIADQDAEAALVGTSASAAGVATAEAAARASELQEQLESLEEEVAHIRNERSMLTATVASLRLEVERWQEEKADAERNVCRLSEEMEELAEALEASNNENERLSLEVLGLRDQIEQLEGGSGTGSDRSQELLSSGGGASRSSRASGAGEPAPPASSRPAMAAAAAAERELAAAKAAARELIWQVTSGSRGSGADGFDDAPAFGGPGEGEDLAQSLKALQVQITELQKQSRQQRHGSASRTSSSAAAAALQSAAAAAAAEVQLAKANARIDELEQLLEDAEIENQHLTEQLEECLTGGRKGPDSVGSVAEECQSSYGGSAAGVTSTSNPYSYGHANTLTLSAFEQRLAMAEGRRDELSAALEEAAATNRRLEADVALLQQQLAAVRRGQDPAALDDYDRPATQVPARARGLRAASDTDDKKRVEELQAANRKLEAVCHDLEEKAQATQERAEQLQADLEDAKERIKELEASAATLQKRLEEETNAGGRQGKEKLSDLEARAARLAREKAAVEEQLAEERQLRQELEDTLKDKLDRDGDDEAAETVATFEAKYNRLKERYKMLEESSQEELDELQDQLNEALGQISDLQRQIKQLQSQLAQNRNAGSALAANGANAEELRNLRSENERLVQQLVSKTMELAELSESEITVRRELARLHEVNMRLAQKATTLEAQVAMAQAAAAKPARGGKK